MPSSSLKDRLSRVRPPQVRLTYDVEIGDAIEARELPFVVGVLADLTGQPEEPLPRIRDRKFVETDADNFDSVLAGMKPHLAFTVENRLTHEPDATFKISMSFRGLEDFEPQNVVRQVSPLRVLLDLRTKLTDLRGTLDTNDRLKDLLLEAALSSEQLASIRDDLTREAAGNHVPGPAEQPTQVSIIDRIVERAHLAIDTTAKERQTDLVRAFMQEILEGNIFVAQDVSKMIQARIAQIDSLLSIQTREILHHPDFQRLEGSWRALAYLVRNTETSSTLKIKVFNASKREIHRDLQRAPEFDQSTMFKKIYEEEFAVFGGQPFSVLIGDFEFGRGPEDIEVLENLSRIAASAQAPFIGAASPALFGLESFTELGFPRDLSKVFDTTECAKWRTFRQSRDSRYVALVVPRMLMRLPYGRASSPVGDFEFEEQVDGTDHTRYLWANSAFGLAARLTSAFATYGWTAAIRGVEGGGVVSDLPVHVFRTDSGDTAVKCPTEVAITDRREKELANLGFIPLVHCKGTDFACFFSAQTCHKPGIYESEATSAAARADAQLPFVLAVSRFAHYLKTMMRDKIGSFTSRSDCERYLNKWITQYVTSDDTATQGTRARYPLKSARIEVTEARGSPGTYYATAFLVPNFQLDPPEVPLRVVTQLPQPAH